MQVQSVELPLAWPAHIPLALVPNPTGHAAACHNQALCVPTRTAQQVG